VRCTCPRSAANTPIWQVTDDSTSTTVLTVENGRLSSSVWVSQTCGTTERIVK
jgi:hypothetical protein